jgi:photosystem II stability/assembly factor-like uncharacterized protein
MKTLIYFLLFLSSLNLFGAEAWEKTNGPLGGGYNSFYATTGNYVFTYTRTHNIHMTSDFGASWIVTPFDKVTTRVWDEMSSKFVMSLSGLIFTNGLTIYYYDEVNKIWNNLELNLKPNELAGEKQIFFTNENVYCVIDTFGVYELSDDLKSWTFFAELSKDFHLYNLNLAITPSGKIFATNYDGLYSSTDYGKSWDLFSAGSSQRVFTADDYSIYWQRLNLCKFNNESDQWDTIISRENSPSNYGSYFIDVSGTIYHYNHLFVSMAKTNDSGKNWYYFYKDSSCFGEPNLNKLYNLHYTNGHVMFNDDRCIYRYSFNAKVDRIDMRFLKYPIDIIHPLSEKKVLVANKYGLYITEDKGLNYKLCFPQCTTGNWYSKIISREDLIVGTSRMNFFYSTNDGNSWIIKDGAPEDFDLDKDGVLYYARQSDDEDMYKSTDFGLSWTSCKGNLPNYGGTKRPYVVALALNDNGQILASIYNDAIYKTTDDGKNWKLVLSTSQRVEKIIKYKNYVYGFGISENNYIIRSSDFGETWETLGNDLLAGKYSFSIGPNGELLASGNGVYTSIDGGYKWKPLNTEFDSNIIPAATLCDDGTMWCGTDSGSVYYSKGPAISVDALLTIYADNFLSPNPATDYIEISVGANGLSSIQNNLIINNIYGQNVLSVGAIHELPLRIDVSSLPSGMYFVRIGDRVQKFVKL